MAEGYFERGEVYWVTLGSMYPGEKGVARPAVIVSNDDVNSWSSCVTVAMLTTKYHENSWEVFTNITGRDSWIMAYETMTYDKARFGKCFGKLNSAELAALDTALEDVFDLGYVDETALKEKDVEISARDVHISELKREVAGIKAEIGKKDEEIASLKMELEMWQKCYGRCMDMLVDVKVNGDLSRRVTAPVEHTEVVDLEEPVIMPKNPEPPKQPEEPKLVDINSATFTQLRGIGLSNNIVLAVINKRPFGKVEDMKNVPGMNAHKYNLIKNRIYCVPVQEKEPEVVEETRKVNVNTASAKELHEVLGLSMTTCYSITGYRKRNGPYKKLEDLLNVSNIYPGTLEKFGHLMEV